MTLNAPVPVPVPVPVPAGSCSLGRITVFAGIGIERQRHGIVVFRAVLLVLLLPLLVVAIDSSGVSACRHEHDALQPSNNKDSDDSDSTCTLYLAESTIPNAGFGVYTTKAVKKNGIVQKADSPSIVITDIERHQPADEKQQGWWRHSDYVWTTYSQEAFEAFSSKACVMNVGALPNFHTALKSAGPHGEEVYDDTIVDRFKDPGAGAFSYHMGHDFIAKYRDIEANEEIFVDYGESWLDSRSESGFDGVPRAQDFRDGESIIGMLKHLLRRTPQEKECAATTENPDDEIGTSFSEQGEAVEHAIPSRFTDEDESAILNLARDIVKLFNHRTAELLPNSPSELDGLVPGIENGLALSKLPKRSTDWIMKNGRCLDNIVPGRSTIHQAGMGGFARRLLPKGSQIVPAPVVLINNRETLTMYGHYEDTHGEWLRDENKIVGKQILLNYCLGHSDSKLLFCPLTNAILVNHCSTRRPWEGQCRKEGPNAAYRWAGDWDPSTVEWLNLTLDELSKKENRGLTLELYATRDIQRGEEIFIDYGLEWEEAWTEHEKNWKPPGWRSEFKSYQSTKELNTMSNETLRTLSERNSNPYPANVLMACIYWESDEDDWVDDIDEYDADNWRMFDDETILEKFGRPGDMFTGSKEGEVFAEFWPCTILMKNEENATAVVRIFQAPHDESTSWDEMGIPRFLTNYSLSSVKFFHQPYKSDQHLPGAFRHHIGLDNYLLPEQWKMSKHVEIESGTGPSLGNSGNAKVSKYHETEAKAARELLEAKDSTSDQSLTTPTCSLYLSQSDSDRYRGQGLFAGAAFRPGQYIDTNPELALSHPDANNNEWSSWHDMFYLGHYTDSLHPSNDNDAEGEAHHPQVENKHLHHWFLPGIASLARCETEESKVNIVHAPPVSPDDDTSHGAQRLRRDAAAGSYSQRTGYTFVATRPIEVGKELLVSCDYDMDNIERSKVLQANTVAGQLKANAHASSSAAAQDPSNNVWWFSSQKKTQQQLQKQSICLDNFAIRPSTIPKIGLGAYAKRSVPVGRTIATTPVLHFDRSQVDVVEQDLVQPNCRLGSEDTPSVVDRQSTNESNDCPPVNLSRDHGISYNATLSPPGRCPTQLLLNYCYGHPNSQVLLLPLAPGVNYINHQDDKAKVNAYLRWSNVNGLADATYLHSLRATEAMDHAYTDMTIDGSTLMVDIVALKDIKEGEEIFLSYGGEWSKAWEKHVAEWTPTSDHDQDYPITATGFRKMMAGSDIARTVKEQEVNPYPGKLRSACYYAAKHDDDDDDEIIDDTRTAFEWTEANRGCLRPCDILERNIDDQGVMTYTVLARQRKQLENEYKCTGVSKAGVKLVNVSPDAITVIDDFYSSAQYLASAFRHAIGVPPNFFPSKWLREDPKPNGDFLGTPLKPGELQAIRWADTGKVATPNAYCVGLPQSLRAALLEYCEKMGIIDIFRHVTVEGNGLIPGTDVYMYLNGKDGGKGEKATHQKWFLQRPDSAWRSNLHWLSPSDEASQGSYLEALGAGGFDQVLDGIGRALGLDGLVAYHLTFIAVSHSIKGYMHHDMKETGAKVYNVIIPLLLAEDTGPELDLGSYECNTSFSGPGEGIGSEVDEFGVQSEYCIGRYRYEYNVASLMGDDALHATSAVDYRCKGEMRMAATVYIADLNEGNVDNTLKHYTQAYPPVDRDLILSWAGKHWLPTGGRGLPKPKPGHHVLAPLDK